MHTVKPAKSPACLSIKITVLDLMDRERAVESLKRKAEIRRLMRQFLIKPDLH